MTLINDKIYIEEFGECKGVGCCGSCHVYVENAPAHLIDHEGKEITTLSRLDYKKENSHLACQIMIDESTNGLKV